MRRLLVRLLVFSLCLVGFQVPDVRAISPLVIGEVNWAGSSLSASDEWIELWNLGETPINLDGYKLVGAGGTNEIFFRPSDVIPAKGVFIVSNYAETVATCALKLAPQLVTSTISLPNDKMLIELFDSANARIDQAGDGHAPFAGLSAPRTSMLRAKPATDGSLEEAWVSNNVTAGLKDSIADFATPGYRDEVIETTPPVSEPPPITEPAQEAPTSTEPAPAAETPPPEEETVQVADNSVQEPTDEGTPPPTTIVEETISEIPPPNESTTTNPNVESLPVVEETVEPDNAVSSSSSTATVTPTSTEEIIISATSTQTQTDSASSPVAAAVENSPSAPTIIVTTPSTGSTPVVTAQTPSSQTPPVAKTGTTKPKTTTSKAQKVSATSTKATATKTAAKASATSTKAITTKAAAKTSATSTKAAVKKSTTTSSASPIIYTTISMLPEIPSQTRVSISGVVASVPKLLAKTQFVIQSADGHGLLVQGNGKQPSPEYGVSVRVSGTLNINDDGIILKMLTKDTWKTMAQLPSPAARDVDWMASDPEDAWSLVHVTATVVGVNKTTVNLEIDSQEVDLVIKSAVPFRAERLLKGDTVIITGIVDARSTPAKIYPRRADEIILVSHAEKPKDPSTTTKTSNVPGWTPFGAAGMTIAFTQGYKRLKKKWMDRRLENLLMDATKQLQQPSR